MRFMRFTLHSGLVLGLLAGVALIASVGAVAYFTAGGQGTGTATVGTLGAPGKPTVTAGADHVTVAWSAASVSGGGAVRYRVQWRPSAGGSWSDACGTGSSTTITATTCQDADASGGPVVYRVGASFRTWTSQSAVSDAVTPNEIARVTNVTSTTSNGTYGSGSTIDVRVTFDEDVHVTSGTPRIQLQTGNGTRYATYQSGSGNQTLVFSYSVASGDDTSDLDYVSEGALTLNGAHIRDDLGADAALDLPAPGHTGSLGDNKSIVLDAVAPALTSLRFADANGNGKVDRVVATFDETLATSGNQSTAWTLSNIPSSGSKGSVSVSGQTATLTITESQFGSADTAASNLQVALSASSSGIRDALGNQASFTARHPDDDADPIVTNVTSTTSNGTYGSGQSIPIQVTFSEPVTVSGGTPALALNSGGAASYSSGSGTSTLTFGYGVGDGDQTSDLNATALQTGAATIADAAGNEPSSTLPSGSGSLGSNKAIVIDAKAPSLTSLQMLDNDGDGKVDRVRAQFDENVVISNNQTGAWTLTDAPSGATRSNTISASGSVVTLTLNEGSGAADTAVGDFEVALAKASNGVRDSAGNQASFAAQAPSDGAAPVVRSVTSSLANGTYGTGQVVPIQVTFSEPVDTTGTPRLTLNTTPSRQATYASGTGTSVLTFDYTVTAGDASNDLNATALSLTGGAAIEDAANNDASTTMPSGSSSLSGGKAIVIDASGPTVSSVTSTTANGTYPAGTTIPITVNFDEPVTVTGTPQLALNTSPAEIATYASGSGSSALTFNYVVASGDASADLNYASTSSLTLNGATMTDAAGNPATLTLPVTSSGSSLGGSKAIVIDAVAPSLTSLKFADANDDGYVDRLVATFDETLTTVTTGQASTAWTFTGTPVGNAAKGTVTVTGNTAIVALTGASRTTAPSASWKAAMAANAVVRDLAGNQAAAFGATSVGDGAGPVPVSASDTNVGGGTNGRFDQGDTFSVAFSENVTFSSTMSPFSVILASSGSGDTITASGMFASQTNLGRTDYASGTVTYANSTVAASGTTVTLTLGGCGSCLNRGTASNAGTFSYVPATTIVDAAGNQAAGSLSVTLQLF